MTKRADEEKALLSRRNLLKRVGIVGAAAAAVPVDVFASSAVIADPPGAFPLLRSRHGVSRWRRSPLPRPTHSKPSWRVSSRPTRTDLAPPRPARRITSIARSAAHSRRRARLP